MVLSDVSIKRPVFATVMSLVLIIFGLFALRGMAVREYPDIDPPAVNVTTIYRGASAEIIESKITQVIEDAVAGIEGIRTITSASREESSSISIEFNLSRNVDAAANDVRDKVGRVLSRLPDEADQPIIAKTEADARPIIYISLFSDRLNLLELTDYADRYLVDQMSIIDGVASVNIYGARKYSMRVYLDRMAMAARNVTVQDIEEAIRRQNVELPSGRIESSMREFTVRTESGLRTAQQFRNIVLREQDGYLLRLGEVAKVQLGAEDERTEQRINGVTAIGMGIIRQSKANAMDISNGVNATVARLQSSLPTGVRMEVSYDQSKFISQSIYEVFHALTVALALVIGVIFLFLRSWRATLIPAIAIPVSVIGSFIVIGALGYSINVLTLLALVLAIGLVVDDAIVVLENIHRRIELGEPPLLASLRGARQIGFAVIATTVVLIAVFVPISLMDGNTGRLFRE
ncbi:MAG: efflux RND transporter permease subunit, partial [Ferrovibrio sp.]